MISWSIKTFENLTNVELYSVFQLRIAVFSVEQNCAYQDADGKDLKSFHLMGTDDNNELIAYARIIPAGLSFHEVSIGRVVTAQKVRRTGAGKELMKKGIEFIQKEFGDVPIRISAQCYLIKFYSGFGFETSGDEYLEDNIAHIQMVKKKS